MPHILTHLNSIRESAQALRIQLEVEPEFGCSGELVFANGKRHVFGDGWFSVNEGGSASVCRDKMWTRLHLQRKGIKTTQGQTFFAQRVNEGAEKSKRSLEEACTFAQSTLRYPVFAKPNNSSRGDNVFKANNETELREAAARIFAKTELMLVEKAVVGRDYRIVVMGDEVIEAYERVPLTVVGNGASTVQQLLAAKGQGQNQPLDPRILSKLAKEKIQLNHVLAVEQSLHILDNSNLSTGGTALPLTKGIHPTYAALAVAINRAIGTYFVGIDLMCADIEAPVTDYTVIEVNSVPFILNENLIPAIFDGILLHLHRKYAAQTTAEVTASLILPDNQSADRITKQ